MSIARFRMHSREELEAWRACDLEIRDELYALIGTELALDIESLASLEAFLLARFGKPDDALSLEQRGVTDAAARHLGLVIVLNVDDARWTIDLDDEKNLYYRLPVIELADGWVTCPLSSVTAALDRRTGSYLAELAQGLREEYSGSKGPARGAAKKTKAKAKTRGRR